MPRFQSAGSLGVVVERYTEIERLQERVKSLLGEIEEVYGQIRRVAASLGTAPVRSRREPKPARAAARGRAPRGALKAAIYKVLAGGKTVRPADIVRELPRVGFRSASKPRVLYTTVYLSLKKDRNILKTKDGFRIKDATQATAKK
jgi:hypothetical protein